MSETADSTIPYIYYVFFLYSLIYKLGTEEMNNNN